MSLSPSRRCDSSDRTEADDTRDLYLVCEITLNFNMWSFLAEGSLNHKTDILLVFFPFVLQIVYTVTCLFFKKKKAINHFAGLNFFFKINLKVPYNIGVDKFESLAFHCAF